MRVTTLLPHPALRPHVVRYLSLEAHFPVPFEQRVGPGGGGGAALGVLMGGTQRVAVPGGVLDTVPPAYLSGHLDRALPIELAGPVRVFIVHFTATGAYVLLGLCVRELTNHAADLGAFAGPDLRTWAAALAEAPDDAARAASTDRVLLARLLAASPKPHTTRVLETATAAAGLIAQAGGRIGVELLAKQLYTTSRTLLRHFEEVVGLPVQAHARIVRFLATRTYLDHHPDVPWSDVVFRFGYADQSHLIRDFQRYYGEPPSVFRAHQHEARLITLVGRDPDTVHGGPVEPLHA
ncbi:MAG: helix-turn-helix domain-containing protein [Rhodothermales bacterium]